MAGNENWTTVSEMARELGATEYSVNRAVAVLGLLKDGKRDITDRRRFIFPPGTIEQVRKWLEEN